MEKLQDCPEITLERKKNCFDVLFWQGGAAGCRFFDICHRINHLHENVVLLPKPECFLKMLSYSNLSSFLGIKGQFSSFAGPIIHHVYPPKFCIMVGFDFSWDMKMTQEKSKTMPMQIFGGLKEVYYGIYKSRELDKLASQ